MRGILKFWVYCILINVFLGEGETIQVWRRQRVIIPDYTLTLGRICGQRSCFISLILLLYKQRVKHIRRSKVCLLVYSGQHSITIRCFATQYNCYKFYLKRDSALHQVIHHVSGLGARRVRHRGQGWGRSKCNGGGCSSPCLLFIIRVYHSFLVDFRRH